MKNTWKISPSQKKLLDALFKNVKLKNPRSVVDAGSGRTSIHYLAHRFKDIVITGIVYPGDDRKLKPILACVPEDNYRIAQMDIRKFNPKRKPEIVLAHLLLGEATKFGRNTFPGTLKKLLSLPSRYLVMVNLVSDNIDYFTLIKEIKKKGAIISVIYAPTESGENCIGMVIELN